MLTDCLARNGMEWTLDFIRHGYRGPSWPRKRAISGGGAVPVCWDSRMRGLPDRRWPATTWKLGSSRSQADLDPQNVDTGRLLSMGQRSRGQSGFRCCGSMGLRRNSTAGQKHTTCWAGFAELHHCVGDCIVHRLYSIYCWEAQSEC